MKKLIAAALAAIALAPLSQAVILDFLGTGDKLNVTITPSVGANAGNASATVAGELFFKDTTNTFLGGATFIGYCLSPGDNLIDPMTVTQTTITGPVGWLVQTFGVNRTGITIGSNTYNANEDAAGFQLAIWKLMDGGLVINSASANALTVMNHYLTVAGSNSDTAVRFNHAWSGQGPRSQDIVTENFGGTSIPVPEPFTMAIGAAGLATALARRRKKA
ncbi:MAG: hypothetical protein ACK41F_04940 [Fimbriimonadaceae bacterium]